MGGRRKFCLSDMILSCWFYKPRDKRRADGRFGAGGAIVTHQSPSSSPFLGAKGSPQPAGTPKPLPVPMPYRASCYCASRDRVLQPSPAPQPTRAWAAATEDRRPQTQSYSSRSYNRQSVGPDTFVGRDGGDVGRRAVKAPSSSKNVFTCKAVASSDTDIIFDLSAENMPESVRRPIVTRPTRRGVDRYEPEERHLVHHAAASGQGRKGNSKRPPVSSGRRLKTRANITSLAESFAVAKASVDPRKDFHESMEEMIAEKGIRDAGDLEDLLGCYLALNAAEHHDLIVEVFEEICASLACVNP